MRPVAALALLLLISAAPDAQVLFREPFKDQLSDGWTWVREDRGDWSIADGMLHVRATPGNVWEKENTARNILLRPPPDGAFVAEVTVSHSPTTFGEQAGLLWYRDDDNYVKLVKEFYDGKLWCVLAAERGGKAEYKEADCRAQWVTFRLTVDGDKVSGHFLPVGGTEWRAMGEYPFERKDARIGLTAHHAHHDSDRKAGFKNFRILQVAR